MIATPQLKSIFDAPPDVAIEAQLDAEAMADCLAARIVPHERVRVWLTLMARGAKAPPLEV